MSTNNDKLKGKIEKLLKKAESAREIGSLEEAAIFMAKANEILTKHKIDQTELNLNRGNDPLEDLVYERVNVKEQHGWAKTDGDWLFGLYGVVSRANFCKIVTTGKTLVTIIGDQENIDVVRFMCNNIIPKLKSLRLKRWKEYDGPEKTNAFKRGYYRGAVHGIWSKLDEQRQADKKKYTGLTDIVLVNNEALDKKTEQIFPNGLTRRKTRELSGTSGAQQGRKDGKNVNINKGLSGRKASPSGSTKLLG